MCGISQVAAAPLQWQRQEARKQPRALHSHTRDKGGGFFIFLSFFYVTICKVTHQQSNKRKENICLNATVLYISWKEKHVEDVFLLLCSPFFPASYCFLLLSENKTTPFCHVDILFENETKPSICLSEAIHIMFFVLSCHWLARLL